MVLALLVLVAGGLVFSRFHGARPRLAASPSPSVSPAADVGTASAKPTTLAPPTRSATHRPAATPNMCKSNTHRQHVIVSIGKQHAWMCNGAHQVYDSNVTTGASADGDGTPTGTWQVLAKQTNRWLTVLSGDSYFVKYWMPYDGPYGFHDASWQNFAYGSGKYRTDGSHGCVHFPLTAMKWVFTWAQVGTTVTVAT